LTVFFFFVASLARFCDARGRALDTDVDLALGVREALVAGDAAMGAGGAMTKEEPMGTR
jgi:hypothetical protein